MFRARDTRARRSQARSMDGQWSTGGGWRIVSIVSPAVFRVFTAVRLEEQVRSVGGRRTEPLAPLLRRFPLSWLGCGVIRRCYSWLTGCWNLSTRGLGDRRISLGNAVRCWDHLDMISKCGEGGFGQGGGEVGVGRRRCCSCSFSFSYVLLEEVHCFINNNNFSIFDVEIDLKTFTNFLFLSYCVLVRKNRS